MSVRFALVCPLHKIVQTFLHCLLKQAKLNRFDNLSVLQSIISQLLLG